MVCNEMGNLSSLTRFPPLTPSKTHKPLLNETLTNHVLLKKQSFNLMVGQDLHPLVPTFITSGTTAIPVYLSACIASAPQ